MLAGFRRRGLIARRPSPTDKREAILAMTASYAMALQVKLEMNTVLLLLGVLIATASLYLRALANSIRLANS